MRKIPIVLNFDRSKPIGHVVLDDEYTRLWNYVLAIGYRGDEVLEFGLIPDSNYLAYLRHEYPHEYRPQELPGRPQWSDIERLSLTEPVIANYKKAHELGHLTREEALIGMVAWMSHSFTEMSSRITVNLQKYGEPAGFPSKEAGLKPGVACWVTNVFFSGHHVKVACDRNCDKAWGINTRPKETLSADPDEYAFLADGELGIAPENPGTSEGGELKPYKPDKHNKWCVRECERASIFEPNKEVVCKDWTKRQYNIPKEDVNADSRSAGTPGGPADA
jgi:hypothetical protein